MKFSKYFNINTFLQNCSFDKNLAFGKMMIQMLTKIIKYLKILKLYHRQMN